ncbi:MAG: type II toxin-antitoxin system VapC family toxin [Candidatus Thiodiazotropha sp. (ex Epidulcina cf. delphinae)]|nr:type II toxin-antitoxin system VapC family toxin [Candidatus Thiodiazotropha sp. (ex Epidulcina cf. delphinae)]
MAVLVDTCGWIEWLTDGALAKSYLPYMKTPETLIIPTSLQFELYKWAKREQGETRALEALALTEQGKVIPLNTSLALFAADLALAHQLSFADAIIYSTARQTGAQLVTSDDHFKGLPEVTYFSK